MNSALWQDLVESLQLVSFQETFFEFKVICQQFGFRRLFLGTHTFCKILFLQ